MVALYRDHSTSEQFHSEFKSGLGLERLPSQKMATNRLVVAIGQLVFNFLRIIGEKAVNTGTSVSKKPVLRLRIRTVLLKLIYVPGRFFKKHRQWCLQLPRGHPFSTVVMSIYRDIQRT